MTRLSDEERLRLRQVLIDTNLYLRAKTQVIEETHHSVEGTTKSEGNMLVDMAFDRGVRMAFEKLEELTAPVRPPANAPVPKRISRETV